jgi:hypothetical protein
MKTYLAYKLISESNWEIADVKLVHADIDYKTISVIVSIADQKYPITTFTGLILVCEDDRKIQHNRFFIVCNTKYKKDRLAEQQRNFYYGIFNDEIQKAINDPIVLTFAGELTDDCPNEVVVFYRFNNVGKFYKNQMDVLNEKLASATDEIERMEYRKWIAEEEQKEAYCKRINAENPLIKD